MTLMGFSSLQRSKLQAKGDGESRPESQSASQPEGLSCSSICVIADDHHIWFEPCFGDSAVWSSRGNRLCHLIHFQSSFVLSFDACFRWWKTTHCKEGTICWGRAYWSPRCRSSRGCRGREQIQVLDTSHVLHQTTPFRCTTWIRDLKEILEWVRNLSVQFDFLILQWEFSPYNVSRLLELHSTGNFRYGVQKWFNTALQTLFRWIDKQYDWFWYRLVLQNTSKAAEILRRFVRFV